MQRSNNRKNDELRDYSFQRNFIKTSEGSVLVSCGDTKVIVTAKIENNVPPFLAHSDEAQGWITAEYSMLPGSSKDRIKRERNKYNARSLEIQRLIGRSLRAMVDLKELPGITINIDADVIQADGGTRTASITGAYVAVYDALTYLQKNPITIRAPKNIQAIEDNPNIEILTNNGRELEIQLAKHKLPILNQIAAISVGINKGEVLLDLDYPEDSSAEADGNFILTANGDIVEIQTTAEDGVIKPENFEKMLSIAQKGIQDLCRLQDAALQQELVKEGVLN
jgi:ribonuclease PH